MMGSAGTAASQMLNVNELAEGKPFCLMIRKRPPNTWLKQLAASMARQHPNIVVGIDNGKLNCIKAMCAN